MIDTVLSLHKAAEQGRIEAVQFWVDHANDVVSSEFDLALRLAAEHGHTECVRLLIPVSDPKADQCVALWTAADKGHTECVRLLIPVSDPQAYGNLALQAAAEMGYPRCLELLIPVSNVNAGNGRALRLAAERGHVECVKMLLPFSTNLELKLSPLVGAARRDHVDCVVELMAGATEEQIDLALMEALRHGSKDCSYALFPHCRPERVLSEMKDLPKAVAWLETQMAEQQRQVLQHALEEGNRAPRAPNVARKI